MTVASRVPLSRDFPLAEEISKRIASATEDLVHAGSGLFVDEVSPVTSELLRFWFQDEYCGLRPLNFHEGQRAAVLSVIYAHEVLSAPDLPGLYNELAPADLLEGERLVEIQNSRNQHPKYAAKMATGTGKTWVVLALMIWQRLNNLSNPEDSRFTSNFLAVTPGLIVYDRLLDSFLGRIGPDGTRDFESSDVHALRELFLPENFRRPILDFFQSNVIAKEEIGVKPAPGGFIAVANWQRLAGFEDESFVSEEAQEEVRGFGEELDESELIDDLLPVRPASGPRNALDVLDRRGQRGRALDFLKQFSRLAVFNDEAHHVSSVRKGEETEEVLWQQVLRIIADAQAEKFIQFDFSATPYNEVSGGGSGKRKKYFPHIVVDFDLRRAMGMGLVKTLVLDRRREIASLPLEFSVTKDADGNKSLSEGQRTMLRAGLTRLRFLEEDFSRIDDAHPPKMLVVCEDTSVVPLVEEFLLGAGLGADDVLSLHSGKKAELGAEEWERVRARVFSLDRHVKPRVVVSVLMLREGFDVNNICVVVPLRASSASILLEQTIGRGLRIMWRGDAAIDELKSENRRLVQSRREPNSYFDMLFIVEHPAFQAFYDELLDEGLGFAVDDSSKPPPPQIERVELKADYELFDFDVPIILFDAEEEIAEPQIDPLALKPSKFGREVLAGAVGKGDVFTGEVVENKTLFGDYRVTGGVMTATGYNDLLGRLSNRIVESHQRAFTSSPNRHKSNSEYPIFRNFRAKIVGWLDRYIRNRLFGEGFDPLEDENWRLLLLEGVAEEISGEFGRALVELQDQKEAVGGHVIIRKVSEVDSLNVRPSNAVNIQKSLFPRLPYPSHSGGLERDFMIWLDKDSAIEAFIKIHEFKHDFLRRPYLKADGMPAQYSPDFLVRTASEIYLVETKSQAGLSDLNVLRKKKAALGWVTAVNNLPSEKRGERFWRYVLAGETSIRNNISNAARASDYLELATLATVNDPETGVLF